MSKVAVVQDAPVLLDLEASLDKAIGLIGQAAEQGAELVVFPEAFLPGYPTWVWRLRPGGDMALLSELHARLLENAPTRDGEAMQRLSAGVAAAGVTVVMGLQERASDFTRSTLYNCVVTLGPDGTVLNWHRKLMPTNPERTVWGPGDASGLRVVETPVGRIGALPCWENLMPLARQALYAEGVEIYVAPTWDTGDAWIATMQHIAREGGCWVIGCATTMQAKDVPADVPGRDTLFPDPEEWVCSGDAVVFAPFGGPVAGPMHREKGLLFAEIDAARVGVARRSFDVCGHYARPDVFQLRVNRAPAVPVRFDED